MLFLQAASQPTRAHTSMLAIADGRVKLILSLALLAEITDVLNRPEYFQKFPAMTPVAVAAYIRTVSVNAEVYDPVPAAFTLPVHPDDDHLFNLAIHASAEYLVTWESRLLKLLGSPDPMSIRLKQLAPKLKIITPKELADLVRQ